MKPQDLEDTDGMLLLRDDSRTTQKITLPDLIYATKERMSGEKSSASLEKNLRLTMKTNSVL